MLNLLLPAFLPLQLPLIVFANLLLGRLGFPAIFYLPQLFLAALAYYVMLFCVIEGTIISLNVAQIECVTLNMPILL